MKSEIVDDILTTAMDSGCAYWTSKVRVIGDVPASVKSTLFPGEEPYASEMLTKGFDLRWIESDDFSETEHVLTRAKMEQGIRRAAKHFGLTVARFHEDHDSDYADVAVQMALFNGEVVYG